MNKVRNKLKGIFSVSFIDFIYKTIIFGDFFRITFPFFMKRYLAKTRKLQAKTIEKLKGKNQIIVSFLFQTPTTWKYDALYKRLEKSERFKPIVVIVPYNVHINYSKNECLKIIKQSEDFAKEQKYNFITSYNFETKKWLDIKKTINPDIIFFTKPYKDTLPKYYIYNFRDKITCFINYGVFLFKDRAPDNFNLPLHNLIYHYFIESELNIPIAQKHALCKGDNITLVGNLGSERLMNKNYIPKDVWKKQNKRKKRIIWAPHHTIDYLFNSSNFLQYCNFMFEMAKKYEDKIQIAFKPHPVLKFRLMKLWGEKKTNEYYLRWQENSNTQLEDGYYDDLFLSSDAMIHDSMSFIVEYLYTNKATCFTLRNKSMENCWTDLAEMAFALHYHAYNEEDIENFIQDIINENDKKINDRKIFIDKYLLPQDAIMPSEKIYKILEEETK